MVLCASPPAPTLYPILRFLSNKNFERGWNTTNLRFSLQVSYELATHHKRHNLTDYATKDASKNRANLRHP